MAEVTGDIVQLIPEAAKIIAAVTVSACSVMGTAGVIYGIREYIQQGWTTQRQQHELAQKLINNRQVTQQNYEMINGLTIGVAASINMMVFMMYLGGKIAMGTILFTTVGVALSALSVVALNYALSKQSVEMEPKLLKAHVKF